MGVPQKYLSGLEIWNHGSFLNWCNGSHECRGKIITDRPRSVPVEHQQKEECGVLDVEDGKLFKKEGNV